MRRLARHLFTLCPAASLLLCGAALVLWLSTWFVAPQVYYSAQDARTGSYGSWMFTSGYGAFAVTRVAGRSSVTRTQSIWTAYTVSLDDRAPLHWRLGLPLPRAKSRTQVIGPTTKRVSSLTLPYWLLLAIASPGAVMWWRERRLHIRRPRAGLCAECGYDLRASRERCPECGTPAAVVAGRTTA